jgi:hypothetical protein
MKVLVCFSRHSHSPISVNISIWGWRFIDVSAFNLPGPSTKFCLNVHCFEKHTRQDIKARQRSEPLKSSSSILYKDAQSLAAFMFGNNMLTSERLNEVVIYDWPLASVRAKLFTSLISGKSPGSISYPIGIGGSSPGGKVAVAWSWPLTSN